MQTVTTSVCLQWHQWSLWRGLSKAVVLAFREVKEAPPQCFLDFLQCSENKMVFWKILHCPCVEPCLCLRLLQLFKPGQFLLHLKKPNSLPPVTSWCHVSLCLAVCLCEFMLSSLHPLLFWRFISNCCLFSFPCPTYYLGWVCSCCNIALTGVWVQFGFFFLDLPHVVCCSLISLLFLG